MDSKQSLAKIGVFILLGVNFGAYYYFWPRPAGSPKAVARAAVQDKGEAVLLPPKAPAPVPVAPMQIPAETVKAAEPLAIPNQPAPFEKKGDELRVATQPTTDPVLKLLEYIDKDKLPELPTLAPAESAKRKEPQKIDLPGSTPRPEAGIAVASALMPKTPPGLWVFQTDKIGTRTQLTARLRDPATERVVVEFRILCDRTQTNSQSGFVQGLGNVTFTGAGWKGACQAVTLPVHEPRVVFEQQVQIMQDILGTSQDGVLRGERVVWEMPTPPNASVSGVTLPLGR